MTPVAGKPPHYRPPPLVDKEGETRRRQPEPKKKTFSGNDCSPKWGPPCTPHNNAANQQYRNELTELRRMVVHNAQPQAHPLFRITYQKLYLEYIDEQNPFPLNFKMPAFPTFSGEDCNVSSSSSFQTTMWHLKTILTTS